LLTDDAAAITPPGTHVVLSPLTIGEFNITNDANGNEVTSQDTGTSMMNQFFYDEENWLSCVNMGMKNPSKSCQAQNQTIFIYDDAGVRNAKIPAQPVVYPNQYFTDMGGSQHKHVFIGSERILTKKSTNGPDKQDWYYHSDQVGSMAFVSVWPPRFFTKTEAWRIVGETDQAWDENLLDQIINFNGIEYAAISVDETLDFQDLEHVNNNNFPWSHWRLIAARTSS
jgi:hypothetical protein